MSLPHPALVVLVASAAWLLGACAAAPPPPPQSAVPAAEAAPAETAAPAPPVEPLALPFHMPCGSDDAVACTNGCNDKFVEDCVTLGAMYLAGTVVTVDRDRAVGLFQTACSGDSARGCMLLGDAYHAGLVPPGATPDHQVADPHAEEVLLYRRACDGGANLGCVKAGRAIGSGHGVERDPVAAARLLSPVCDRGNPEACLELGKLVQLAAGAPPKPPTSSHDKPGPTDGGMERALSLFRKACGLGLTEACVLASPKGEARSPRE